jgi:SNF2 family DNA or RNA helicase
VGYSQFRALLNPKKRSEENVEVLRKWLLHGPDIVIADEAHEIKNDKTMIGKLLAEVKTGSRIAMTGSPLSNHLEEYWAMMSWIHPGFLGSLKKFTTEYITPIKDGLYRESNRGERMISQNRLLRLKTVLNDKLLRRDLSVIEADLPKKSEFIIHLPLSPLQRQLYETLIEERVWERHGEKGLFKWINILRLICNHPLTLMVCPLLVLAYVLETHPGPQTRADRASRE